MFALPVFAFHIEGHTFIVPLCASKQLCKEVDPVTNQETIKEVGAVCAICDIFLLLQSILNFIWWYITIPLAALFLAYGGVLMILPYIGGSAAMHEKGRKVITQAFVGILIIFFAWLAIDTIIKVVGQQAGLIPVAIHKGGSGNDTDLGPWNEVNCAATGGNVDIPLCEPLPSDGVSSEDDITTIEETLAWQLSLPPEGTGIRGPGANFVCDASGLADYDQLINEQAEINGVSANRIKATILAESGGSIISRSDDNDGKHSYGIMQIRPETARDLHPPFAGLSDTEVGQQLQSNPELSIELGARYYGNKLRDEGGNNNLASAAYNGGPAANNPSVNCSGVPSANGGTMRRWECPCDSTYNPSAKTCTGEVNTGYQVTRNYVPKVNLYEAALDAGSCP